jgi:hypothetical protein
LLGRQHTFTQYLDGFKFKIAERVYHTILVKLQSPDIASLNNKKSA